MVETIYENDYYKVVVEGSDYSVTNKQTGVSEFRHTLLPVVIKTAQEAAEKLDKLLKD